ncbi:MAG: DUF971 domain-containing protein [Gammaproteobacteria bacterium]|nr:DUF971 domain-containing protein [Gammaproteobacteria bacterium]
MSTNKVPVEIKLHKKSAMLELVYSDNTSYRLSAEFLRVHSPSAEVRGHGTGQETLQVGKKFVNILAIEPVGNYAIKLVYDDHHDSGIYSWDYLLELCANHDRLLNDYLNKLKASNSSREPLPPGTQAVNIMPLASKEKTSD